MPAQEMGALAALAARGSPLLLCAAQCSSLRHLLSGARPDLLQMVQSGAFGAVIETLPSRSGSGGGSSWVLYTDVAGAGRTAPGQIRRYGQDGRMYIERYKL